MAAVDSARAGVAATSMSEVAAVRAAIRRMAAEAAGAGRWTGEERHELLGELDRAVDALAAVRAAVLVAERDAGTWQRAGDRSIEAWRARTSQAGQRTATAQVRQAGHLAAAPAAEAAVLEGRIGMEHAAVIGAVAANGTPAQRDAALSPAGQRHLIELAEQQDAGTFATTVARWAATIDPAGLERDHQAQRRERFLQISDTPRGTFLKGRLDSMAGRRLTQALEALSPRPGAEDDRDPGQRRADALDAMATRILASSDTRPGAHVPPQITMILTEATWVAARDERDRRRRAGAGGPAVVAEGYAPATLEDGTPVPVSELAAAMCDCEITRIVIDADGVPLDVGRAQRVFTGPQRRAVITRDRGCAWPECQTPARWCEVHHLRWWDRDSGPTSVENGMVLCSYHHHEVHRRDLVITRSVGDGAPPGGSSPGTAAGTALSRVAYEFKDREGRVIAPVPTADRATSTSRFTVPSSDPPGHACAAPMAAAAGPEPPGSRAERPISPARGVPRPQAPPGTTEDPALEWVEDPVRG